MKTAAQQQVKLPAEPRPEQLTAIIDSREKLPLDLSPLKVVTGSLSTGDYSLLGLESIVAIERKSLGDMLSCMGGERERFEREVQRLLAFEVRALVVESDWRQFQDGGWSRSRITPAQAIGSLLGWSAAGLPIIMSGSHEQAGRDVARLLYITARRRWREARSLVGSVMEVSGDE